MWPNKEVVKELKELYLKLYKTNDPQCPDITKEFDFQRVTLAYNKMSPEMRLIFKRICEFFMIVESAVERVYRGLIGRSRFEGINDFLSIWAKEEPLHGAFFAKVLQVCGIPLKVIKAGWIDIGAKWIIRAVRPFGSYFIDVLVMLIGWINELITEVGYQELKGLFPFLEPVTTRIAGQEHRHMAFYGRALVILLKHRGSKVHDYYVDVIHKYLPTIFANIFQPVGASLQPKEARSVMNFLLRSATAQERANENFALLGTTDDSTLYVIERIAREKLSNFAEVSL